MNSLLPLLPFIVVTTFSRLIAKLVSKFQIVFSTLRTTELSPYQGAGGGWEFPQQVGASNKTSGEPAGGFTKDFLKLAYNLRKQKLS